MKKDSKKPSASGDSPALRKTPSSAETPPLRVYFSRRAYGDVSGHARESLEAEVGGVLVGQVREDEQGEFVEVEAIVRALSAREARAHVTFTHETWTQIHDTIDLKHAGKQIVGWYHTHPGFGVEFSTMDRFIHENFFSGKSKIALVTDPLGGDTAVLFNGEQGLDYLKKFWVDDREHTAKLPPGEDVQADTDVASTGRDLQRDIERLEARVTQLIQAVDEQRANFYRTLTAIFVTVCLGIVGSLAYWIYTDRFDRLEPPRVQSYVPMPIKIGNETVMLGIGIVNWRIPPRLDALLERATRIEIEERLRREEELRTLEEERRNSMKPKDQQ